MRRPMRHRAQSSSSHRAWFRDYFRHLCAESFYPLAQDMRLDTKIHSLVEALCSGVAVPVEDLEGVGSALTGFFHHSLQMRAPKRTGLDG